MHKQGILAVISGFSGAGKGTLVKKLIQKYDYSLSISATTRRPRLGESEGKDYFFLTKENFESMIEKEQLIEWAEYVGHYYGTPKEYVEHQRSLGKDVILEIEIQGALKIKEQYPDTLLIFVTPPNTEELKKRLQERGSETKETIYKRVCRAAEEADFMEQYDYILVNDVLEESVEILHQMIQNSHFTPNRNRELIAQIKQDLKRERTK